LPSPLRFVLARQCHHILLYLFKIQAQGGLIGEAMDSNNFRRHFLSPLLKIKTERKKARFCGKRAFSGDT
jgi:hypothetical protein